MALKNLFLKDYTGVDEDDYSISVYTQHGVYDSLFHVLDQASSPPSSSSLASHTPCFCFYHHGQNMKSNDCNVAGWMAEMKDSHVNNLQALTLSTRLCD